MIPKPELPDLNDFSLITVCPKNDIDRLHNFQNELCQFWMKNLKELEAHTKHEIQSIYTLYTDMSSFYSESVEYVKAYDGNMYRRVKRSIFTDALSEISGLASKKQLNHLASDVNVCLNRVYNRMEAETTAFSGH